MLCSYCIVGWWDINIHVFQFQFRFNHCWLRHDAEYQHSTEKRWRRFFRVYIRVVRFCSEISTIFIQHLHFYVKKIRYYIRCIYTYFNLDCETKYLMVHVMHFTVYDKCCSVEITGILFFIYNFTRIFHSYVCDSSYCKLQNGSKGQFGATWFLLHLWRVHHTQ